MKLPKSVIDPQLQLFPSTSPTMKGHTISMYHWFYANFIHNQINVSKKMCKYGRMIFETKRENQRLRGNMRTEEIKRDHINS